MFLRSLTTTALLILSFTGCANNSHLNKKEVVTATQRNQQEASVNSVLNELHEQASAANFERYFSLYTDDAVFLGTDRDEYWPIEDFKAYAKPHFDKGNGWTYTPLERQLHFAGNTAWFEEQLLSESYGQVRGTGVLVRTDNGWKVAQYNLTLPIPNPIFDTIAEDIKAYYRDNKS